MPSMPNIKSNESVKTLTMCELRNRNVKEQKQTQSRTIDLSEFDKEVAAADLA